MSLHQHGPCSSLDLFHHPVLHTGNIPIPIYTYLAWLQKAKAFKVPSNANKLQSWNLLPAAVEMPAHLDTTA